MTGGNLLGNHDDDDDDDDDDDELCPGHSLHKRPLVSRP